MPIYEYQCENCGLRFDRFESMSASPALECPECHGPVHRVITPVGVIFKGSGFYVTDNRRSSTATARGSRKTEDSSSKSDGDSTASSGESRSGAESSSPAKSE